MNLDFLILNHAYSLGKKDHLFLKFYSVFISCWILFAKYFISDIASIYKWDSPGIYWFCYIHVINIKIIWNFLYILLNRNRSVCSLKFWSNSPVQPCKLSAVFWGGGDNGKFFCGGNFLCFYCKNLCFLILFFRFSTFSEVIKIFFLKNLFMWVFFCWERFKFLSYWLPS